MTTMDDTLTLAGELLRIEAEHVAHNYHPLDVVASGGSGAMLTDTEGVQYLDCLLYTSPSPRDGLLSRMPSSA